MKKRKPLTTFVLRHEKRRLRVVVWPTFKELRAELKASYKAQGARQSARDAAAFFEPLKGSIHLCAKYVGAGIWAHELQHYIDNVEWLRSTATEEYAELAASMTTQFWSRYYSDRLIALKRPSAWAAIVNHGVDGRY